MKAITYFLSALLISALCFSCQKNTAEMQKEQEEYQMKVEAKLDQINHKIGELRADANDTSEEIQSDIENQISTLEEKEEALSNKLNDVWNATEDNWEEVKSDIDYQLAQVERFLDDKLQAANEKMQ